uniref:Uncharacterized protein n=1 Tax=Mizugakiibacter sediminis TaxID=1475481 RepID=A0A0S6YYI3_9GAMM
MQQRRQRGYRIGQHALRRLRGVEHAEAPRERGGARAVGGAHAFEERVFLAFDAVGVAASGGARAAVADRQVEQQRQVRLQVLGRPTLQLADARLRLAAAAALVGVAGVGEAVAQHPAARRQRGPDHLAHQLRARGEHQQQFRLGADAAQRGIEHQRAHRLAERRAARLARQQQVDAMRFEMVAQAGQQRALAGALAPFEGDESSAHRFLPSW